MKAMPALYVSHGPPTLVIENGPASNFFEKLGAAIPRPGAILAVSAHWEEARPTASLSDRPDTLHDFSGFPPELHEIEYPAPGAPDLAREAVGLLEAAGVSAETFSGRGLDHGAWSPLALMYPEADIPVTQLSLAGGHDPALHYRIGRALAPLRERGALILASGGATHNLARLGPDGGEPPEWAETFDQWLAEAIETCAIDDLFSYRDRAPYVALAHPSAEHLTPLFVAIGSAGLNFSSRRLNKGFVQGAVSMAAYAFSSRGEPLTTLLD